MPDTSFKKRKKNMSPCELMPKLKKKKKIKLKKIHDSLSISLSALCSSPCLPLPLRLFPTFLAEGDGIVHDPADQSHEQPQQNQEDPVFPHPRDQELLAARRTHCKGRETRF